ncbi:unnamed protein product, partial [Nesidiocoris tenuis]
MRTRSEHYTDLYDYKEIRLTAAIIILHPIKFWVTALTPALPVIELAKRSWRCDGFKLIPSPVHLAHVYIYTR